MSWFGVVGGTAYMGTATQQLNRAAWAERTWDDSLAYIRTVVDTAYNPFLILDEHLRVLAANNLFYKLVHADQKNTEPKYLNELGNGVWNLHALRALLVGRMPKNISYKNIAVSSEFPSIGKKIMLLNGKRVQRKDGTSEMFSPVIILAMGDGIQMTVIAAELADYAARVKGKMNKRTHELEMAVEQLKKRVGDLKIGRRKST